MIEEARVKFSGTSAESFDEPPIGEQRTYTVLATCTTHTEQDMKNEGARRTVTMKIDKVLEGVTQKIHENDTDQPNLFDSEPDPDPEDEDAEEDGTVVDFSGPSFSAGDE